MLPLPLAVLLFALAMSMRERFDNVFLRAAVAAIAFSILFLAIRRRSRDAGGERPA